MGIESRPIRWLQAWGRLERRLAKSRPLLAAALTAAPAALLIVAVRDHGAMARLAGVGFAVFAVVALAVLARVLVIAGGARRTSRRDIDSYLERRAEARRREGG